MRSEQHGCTSDFYSKEILVTGEGFSFISELMFSSNKFQGSGYGVQASNLFKIAMQILQA